MKNKGIMKNSEWYVFASGKCIEDQGYELDLTINTTYLLFKSIHKENNIFLGFDFVSIIGDRGFLKDCRLDRFVIKYPKLKIL